MATYYVDNVNGADGNDGLSEGAAKATIAAAVSAASDDDTIYIQDVGTNYTLTAQIDVTKRLRFEGYTTTPGNRDGRPTITSSTNSVNLFDVGAVRIQFVHLELTHTAVTRGIAIANTSGSLVAANHLTIEDCIIDGCSIPLSAYYGAECLTVAWSIIRNCTNTTLALGLSPITLIDSCIFQNNAGSDLYMDYYSQQPRVTNSIFIGSPRAIYFNSTASWQYHAIFLNNNIFYGQTSDAIYNKDSTGAKMVMTGNIFSNIGGYAIKSDATSAINNANRYANNNAFYSITSGAWSGFSAGLNDITLSASPFIDAAGGDFNINDTAGGGAVLRAANIAVAATAVYPFRNLLAEQTFTKFFGIRA